MLRLLTSSFLIIGLLFSNARAETPRSVTPHSRTNQITLAFSLEDSAWRWLGKKREVKVAVYAPDNPPFNLLIDDPTVEGLSADYTQLVLRYLSLRFQFLRYSSRSAALDALQNGEVDMLVDDAGGQTDPDSQLLRSQQFVADHPALVSRDSTLSNLQSPQPGTKIAMTLGYLNDDWVKQHYPDAQITRYASTQHALSSVAFGENAFFIGNVVSVSYLIERNYASTLSIAHVFHDRDTGPRFVFPTYHATLMSSINHVLAAITPQQHDVIMSQWGKGPELWRATPNLQFTESEQRWLAQHNTLRVAINKLDAPFTLSDNLNKINGITIDLLQLIHLRTGINFTTVEATSLSEMMTMVKRHEADLIGSLAHSEERENQLMFTRPYVQPPYVLVSRNTLTAPRTLAETTTLAIMPDHALIGWLQKNYPHTKLVIVENTIVAMQMVDEGRVDGAVNNLIATRYLMDRYFGERLHIVTPLGQDPARIAFGVARDSPELHSILNKVLADIPPRNISLLAMRWQGTPDVKIDSWRIYRHQFYWLAGIFAALVLTSLFWNYHLHRAVRQRKEAQATLQQQATFLETLFNGTPVPVYVIDTDGKMINHNPAWDYFFRGELTGLIQLPLDAPQHPLHAINQVQMKLLAENAPSPLPPQNGRLFNGCETRSVIHQAEAFHDNQGRIAGLICSWQDITEHQQLLADLSQARERAEQANRTKSTFLATMSHEIRTPISAIIGLLELAVTDNHRQQIDKESVRVAYESALSLMGLIGDILDMAKIESGKLELAPEWINFDALAEPVVHVFTGLARQKGLQLNYHVDMLHPDELLIDPMRLRQILSNLISNAIKFTDYGSVEVRMRCLHRADACLMLEITVTDTGIGISEVEQTRLFNRYEQTASGKKQIGTGLGLAICEQLVSMMSGTIRLRSQPQRGTQICVRIPVSSRAGTEVAIGQSRSHISDAAPLTVLTVDDHPANRLLLKRQLSRLGHRVIEAEDGAQALKLWHLHDINLVITDCNMPVMDGFELTRQLRSTQRGPLTIMGLTANAQPEERMRCLAAGMDQCLFKPLRLSQLEALLHNIARAAPVINEKTRLRNLLDFNVLRELVQDDEEMLQRLLHTTRHENSRDIASVNHCYLENDTAGVAHYLHRLAGSTQVIGANEIARRCRQLEFASNEGVEPLELDDTLADIHRLNQAIDLFIAESTV